MGVSRETLPAYFRPAERRLASLTNEELQALYELRAAKVRVNPKGLWEDCRSVFWCEMIPPLEALHEVMLEIQARYPRRDILEHARDGRGGGYFRQMLPLNETEWVIVAMHEHGLLPAGLVVAGGKK